MCQASRYTYHRSASTDGSCMLHVAGGRRSGGSFLAPRRNWFPLSSMLLSDESGSQKYLEAILGGGSARLCSAGRGPRLQGAMLPES